MYTYVEVHLRMILLKLVFCLQTVLHFCVHVQCADTNSTRTYCLLLLQQNNILPLLDLTTIATTTTSNTTTTTTPLDTVQCQNLLFGANATVDWRVLPEYSTTTTKVPTPTTTTTLSAEEKRQIYCEGLKYFSYEMACGNPCDACVDTYLDMIKGYFACKTDLFNNTHEALQFKNEPMVLALLINQFAAQLNQDYNSLLCPVPPLYNNRAYFLFYSDKKYRYSDIRLPDYDAKFSDNDVFPNKRWNQKNDTFEVPYGNLPRGSYSIGFVMYEDIIDQKILPEKTRFKTEWPDLHPIITGVFIDTRVEPGLYENDRLIINSIIISIEISPRRDYPLPGENVISFTHFDRTLANPVCVYWQPLDPGQNGKMADQGYWSNYGVRVFKTNHSMTVCRSTHFGIFTVLMEPPLAIFEEETKTLDVISVLFVVVSLIGLIIYVVAMVLLKCYMNHHSRLYILIALSLFFAQLLYLVGIAVRSSWNNCTTVAAWMNFFYIKSITWIFLESIHQLSRIRHFFNEDTNIDAFYMVLGFGFPLSVLISLQEFPYDHFEKLQFCWVYISGSNIWFFVCPLLVLVVCILAIRIITYLELQKKPEKLEKDIDYARAWKSILGAVTITPTIVTLWALATWSVRDGDIKTDIGQIVKPILDIVVACEILYFYFYGNDEVRDALTEEMKVRETQKLLTYRHLLGLDMKVKYQANDKDENIIQTEKSNGKDIYISDKNTLV